jgi:hypothetical protein
MVIKRLAAAAVCSAGVLVMGLGLLFLIGSAGQTRRLAVAVLALALGGVAAGFGLRAWRRLDRLRPEVLRGEILDAARRRSGIVSEDDLVAALGRRWAAGSAVLRALVAEGVCESDAGRRLYVFPSLQSRLAVRRCEYCGSELPLEGEVTSCPSCGGTVRLGVERVGPRDGDAYRMDE